MDDYRAIKQRLACAIKSQFDGAEMLNLKQAATVLGYKDPRKALGILSGIPVCKYPSGDRRWSVTDLSAELAKRTQLPDGA